MLAAICSPAAMPNSSRLFVGIVVVLAGCGPNEGAGTGSDSGDPGGTSEPTGGDLDGVRVIREDLYIPAVGKPVARLADPLATDLELAIRFGDQEFIGSYDGAGERRFADVPDGPYLLRRDAAPDPGLPGTTGFRRFTATDLRVHDFGAIYSGRADVATTAAPGTSLRLSVTDMQPLQYTDNFELYSHDADAWSLLRYDGEGSPFVGDDEISGWKVAWDRETVETTRDATPLINRDKGDALRLAHLVNEPLVPAPTDLTDPWSYARVDRLIESAALNVQPMNAGANAPATGAFAAVKQKTLKLDLRLGAYLATMNSFNPEGTDAECSANIFLEPGVETPVLGITPTLATLSVAAEVPVDPSCFPNELGECDLNSCADGCDPETTPAKLADRVVELSYGNPYGPGTESISVTCNSFVRAFHPKSGAVEPLSVDVFTNLSVADLDGPLAPTLGPPTNLRVNGEVVAAIAVSEVGLTPTISFDAPTIGVPDSYTIVVRTLEDVLNADANILSRRRAVASVLTEDTTVQIPAGVLTAGAFYYFQVLANVGTRLESPRRSASHTMAGARAATGIVTP